MVKEHHIAPPRHRSPWWLVWLVALLVLLAPPVFAHPDLDLQIDKLTLQLTQDPDNIEWLLKRGDLQRRHENWNLARADFKRVRNIQADNDSVDWFEGRLEVESGRPEIGIVFLDEFLEANPGHVIALQNRAQANLSLGQPILAAQDFQTVIRISDKPAPSLYSAEALALIKAGFDHFAQAMEVVEAGLKVFPAEVMLSGLGTDISLARADVETAGRLISRLPDPILKLSQWQTRQALLDCENGKEEIASQWFAQASARSEINTRRSQSRHQSVLLTDGWLVRLANAASIENCQSAALYILQQQ